MKILLNINYFKIRKLFIFFIFVNLTESKVSINFESVDGIKRLGSNESIVQVNVPEVKISKICKTKCLILNCEGNRPIEWSFENLIKVPREGIELEIFNSYENKNGSVVYKSRIIVKKLKKEFTGWYKCIEENGVDAHELYFLIWQRGTHLLEENKLKVTYVSNKKEFYIPCRINSITDSKIVLFYDGNMILEYDGEEDNKNYSLDKGFKLSLADGDEIPERGRMYECRTFSKNSPNSYLLIHVLLEKNAPPIVSPISPFVTVKEGEALNLTCNANGIATQIVPKRNMNQKHEKNLYVKNADPSYTGKYYCILKTQSNKFKEAKILFSWSVRVLKITFNVELKKPLINKYRTCQSTSTKKITNTPISCPCLYEQACKRIENRLKIIKESENRCSEEVNSDSDLGDFCSEIKKSDYNIYDACNVTGGYCSVDFEIPPNSGFLVCKGDLVGEDEKRLCRYDYSYQIENIKNKELNEDEKCVESNSEGTLWMEGDCESVLTEPPTSPLPLIKISCFAHKSSYMDGVEWYYTNAQNEQIKINQMPNYETQLTSSGDRVKSNEVYEFKYAHNYTSPFSGKVKCQVRGLRESKVVDSVEIVVQAKELKGPSFTNKFGKTVSSLVKIGTKHSLNCEVDSFPSSKISWKKQSGNNSYEDLDTILIKTFKYEKKKHVLLFEKFLESDAGTYICDIKLNYKSFNYGITRQFILKAAEPSSAILIGCLVGLLIIVIIAILIAVFYRQRFKIILNKVQLLTDKEIDEFVNGNVNAINSEIDIAEQAHLLPYNSSYEFPKANLKIEKQLGSGAYGTVMRAIAEDLAKDTHNKLTTVAIKTIQPNADIIYFKALLMELKIMIHIGHHPNIVALLGAVTKKITEREVLLIVEYCKYGNMLHYLQNNKRVFANQIVNGRIDPSITHIENTYINMSERKSKVRLSTTDNSAQFSEYSNFEKREKEKEPLWRNNVKGDYAEVEVNKVILTTTRLIDWCYQISKGMEYLCTKKVIHGDLAARNVLIADEHQIKISDFGLSRQMYKDENYTKTQKCLLPIKWMAIESIQSLTFSSKSDVWSFAVVAWEIFTLGDNPYPGISIDDEFLPRLKNGYRMSQPSYMPNEMHALVESCWSGEAEQRPSFSEVVEILSNFILNVN